MSICVVTCPDVLIQYVAIVLQPTVCERELCVFAFQTLGVMNEAADEIATGAQVLHIVCVWHVSEEAFGEECFFQ